MPVPAVHTVPRGDGWANEVEGTSTVLSMFATKDEAVTAGRAAASAMKVEHIIHNADGSIGDRKSYGTDASAP